MCNEVVIISLQIAGSAWMACARALQLHCNHSLRKDWVSRSQEGAMCGVKAVGFGGSGRSESPSIAGPCDPSNSIGGSGIFIAIMG